VSHLGFFPLPDHFSPCGPLYFGATLCPFLGPRGCTPLAAECCGSRGQGHSRGGRWRRGRQCVRAREHVEPLPPNVKHLGRVDDNDLAFLYQNALCLAFPSRAEGFGLPAVEAMALGCPVVSSKAASLPEVCGDAALYAPPNSPSAWLDAIEQLAGEPILYRRFADAGRKRAVAFSWRRGAMKYLELMRALESPAVDWEQYAQPAPRT
jgi:glycosyltransferase involved in cell wall biosynthesis